MDERLFKIGCGGWLSPRNRSVSLIATLIASDRVAFGESVWLDYRNGFWIVRLEGYCIFT